MTRSLDSIHAELPATARSRVRLPERFPSATLFPGWGPGLGRS
jgi:hypothetical protein